MIRMVSGCKDCGAEPCMRCTEVEKVCDDCEDVVKDLYWFDGRQVCEECWKEDAFDTALKVKS